MNGPKIVRMSESIIVFFLPKESDKLPPMKAPIVAPKTAVLTTFFY